MLTRSSNAYRVTVLGSGQSLIHHDLRGADLAGFNELCERVRAADVAFTNFEASLAREGDPPVVPAWGDIPTRPSKPETLEYLAWMGFDLLSLANNHSFEGGANGLRLTKQVSAELGFTAAGTGETIEEAAAPSYRDVDGVRVGFVAADSANLQTRGAIAGVGGVPGVNPMRGERGWDGVEVILDEGDLERNVRSVQEAAANADIVVVSMHEHMWPEPDFFKVVHEREWHEEWRPPMAWKHRFGRAMIDAGATVVFMHGMPRASAVEVYRGKPIFHGLGNFVFHATVGTKSWVMPEAWKGFVAEIDVENGAVVGIRLRPIRLLDTSGGRGESQSDRVLPALVHGEDGADALRHVIEDSEALGTTIVPTSDAWEVVLV